MEEKTLEQLHLENAASLMLLDIGLDPATSGFKYIKAAMFRIIRDHTLLSALTTRLYPELASTFRGRRDSPERLMRHSIMKLFLYGDTDIISAYFGNVPMPNGYPPVGTFLATMTEHLNIQLEFYEMHLEEFDRAAKWPAGLMRKTDEGAENNGKA